MERRPARLLSGFLLAAAAACTHTRTLPAPDEAKVRAALAEPGHAREDAATTALVDRILRENWASAHLGPAPRASPGEFLRRATLDLAGRTPTLEEARAWLAETAPDRAARLVERLLAGPDYVRHWTDVYLTLLVGRDQRTGGPARQILQPWLANALADGRPWDALATDLITATGTLADAPAGAFLLRHAQNSGPEAVTGRIASVFLGLQIQCAQCHDHPYDSRWKQADFYGLVGYVARTKVRRAKGEGPLAFEVFDQKKGEARMTVHDSGREVTVTPTFLGRALPESAAPRREALAQAVVRSDLFAKEAVNRVWAQLFGRGLVDPVDDLGGERDPAHPPLLAALAADFAGHGYDLRRLLRSLALCEAYARSSEGGEAPAAAPPNELERHFARAAVRPMQPEQLFRALLTETGAESALTEKLGEEGAAKRLEQSLRQYLFVYGDDEMGEVDAFRGTVPQALSLLNGDVTNLGAKAKSGGTLTAALAATKDRKTRVETLFLAAYARPPSVEETALALTYLDGRLGSRDAFEDLFHSLLTSTEAITLH